MMSEVNRRERRRSFFQLGRRERVGPPPSPSGPPPFPPGPHHARETFLAWQPIGFKHPLGHSPPQPWTGRSAPSTSFPEDGFKAFNLLYFVQRTIGFHFMQHFGPFDSL